jgi:putative restriction endonuclease
MRAHSQDESNESESSDGFNLVPRNPKKIFLLKVNPLIHHLPTELAVSKIKKWRVPSVLAKLDEDSVVVLWQDGPDAGIYGIALPYGKDLTTDSYFVALAGHLKSYRYSFAEVKLRTIYIPPTPILSTTLPAEGMLASEMNRSRARLLNGRRLHKKSWKEIYDLMSHRSNSEFPSAIQINTADKHSAVEFIQHRENLIYFDDVDSQLSDPYALAQRVWNVLTQSIVNETPLDNTSLCELFGVTLSEIRTVIGLIDEICVLENLPRLTSPIVLKHESPDHDEHQPSTLANPLHLTSMPQDRATRNFDWEQISNPFDFTLQCSSQKIMSELESATTVEQAADIYKTIKVRGTAQQIFAKLMRRLYGRQCAFCGFSMPFALEAAHIKPWTFATPGERLLASNGLLLCSVHHKLFDAGLITLSVSRANGFAEDRYVVRVLAPDSLLCISEADVDYVKKVDGIAPRLPEHPEHRPSAEFLDFRKNWVSENILRKAP